MPTDATIKARFDADHQDRFANLEIARVCASLTKPWVLPPQQQLPNQKLPENYQSVGSRGVTNLEGKMLAALYPADEPWFALLPAAAIRYDPDVDPAMLNAMQEALFRQELLIQATLESAGAGSKGAKAQRRSGFHSGKRSVISQLLICGDVLEHLGDDYRIKKFRLDQYTTRRDSSGDVLYHTITETIDPLTLTPEQIEKAGLRKADLEAKGVADRMVDIYTLVEWQPLSKTWKVRQEVNGKEIVEFSDPVSAFFSTPFELTSGEHYGRGFIELNLGELRSLNELSERILDFAAIASKILIAKDNNSEVRDEDLTKRSGSIIHARVAGGVIQDLAVFQSQKLGDFQIVHATVDRLRKDMGGAMLMESEVTPRGDRVTAFQASRVAAELEGGLGGFYATINDDQHVPLLRRTMYQLRKDKLLPVLPDDSVEVQTLTGIAALSRQARGGRVLGFVEAVSKLGPEAMARVDPGVLVDVLRRYGRIDEPGLVKTREQARAEQQQAMADQASMAAAERGIDAVGTIAENAASAATPQGT